MKANKLANGNVKLKLSRSEWEKMGREAGWGSVIKELFVNPVLNTVEKAFAPEYTNPTVRRDDEDSGSFRLTNTLEEQTVMQTPASAVNMGEVEKKYNAFNSADPDFLLAFKRGLDFVNNPSRLVEQKTINGMKVLLYRIVNLDKDTKNSKLSVAMLKKWYQQKLESDRMWDKPKNPYL